MRSIQSNLIIIYYFKVSNEFRATINCAFKEINLLNNFGLELKTDLTS